MSVAKEKEERLKVIGGFMNKKCLEILNKLESEGKIKISGYQFPQKQDLQLRLKDMLEDEVDEKYYLSEMVQQRFKVIDETFKKNIIGTTAPIFRTIGQRDSVYQTNSIMGSLVATDYKQPKQILIKEATKKGYKEAYDGDSVNLEQPNSKTRRGRVGNQVAQTLTTSCNQAVVEPFITKKYKEFEKSKGYTPNMFNPYNKSEINDIAPTQSTQCGSTTSSATVLIKNDLRIRKLTPKECWRLMGFDDEDFEKASQVNSNAQLYKQAGNSIVVNVLEAIFKELF